MSGPSDKAKLRGTQTINTGWELGGTDTAKVADCVLRSAHDPALGLDRSVCLRDVVEFLRPFTGRMYGEGCDCAAEVEREFTDLGSA